MWRLAAGACAVPTFEVSTQVGITKGASAPDLAKMLAGSILGQARAMDGAGRLARSLRSLGPQADLKAAAIGAGVLLREWLGLPARVKAPIDRTPPNRVISWLERFLPNRTGVMLTVLMLFGSAGLGIVKGGHLDELTAALRDTP